MSNSVNRIELITENDENEVLELLKTYFFKGEPLCVCLDIGVCKELEQWIWAYISDGCSFKALNSNGEIIGVAVNSVHTKNDQVDHNPDAITAATCKHKKFKTILTFMEYIETQVNLFNLYPQFNCFLDGKILTVNGNCRGSGIASQLIQHTIDYMHKHSIPLFAILCTSHYSARACEKLGFKDVYALRYDNYIVNDCKPLLPNEPHVAARMFVKEI